MHKLLILAQYGQVRILHVSVWPMEKAGQAFARLTQIIKQLRDPEKGCPWDKEQTHQSLKPYIIEESYEAIDAIDKGDPAELCAELGDVLLQVVLHAQVASDSGAKAFNAEDICNVLSEKLIRRHPHVFGEEVAETSNAVLKNWEKIKATERNKKGGALAGIPSQLPGLLKAQRLGEKTARLGFDWTDSEGVTAKIIEELAEIQATTQSSPEREEEFGDLLFTLVQWSRHQKIDAEEAMRKACAKFINRFTSMEELSERPLSEMSMEEKENLWQKVKLVK